MLSQALYYRAERTRVPDFSIPHSCWQYKTCLSPNSQAQQTTNEVDNSIFFQIDIFQLIFNFTLFSFFGQITYDRCLTIIKKACESFPHNQALTFRHQPILIFCPNPHTSPTVRNQTSQLKTLLSKHRQTTQNYHNCQEFLNMARVTDG